MALLLIAVHIRLIYLISWLFGKGIIAIYFAIVIGIIGIAGYFSIMYGYRNYGMTGASMATIFFIAVLIATLRPFYNNIQKMDTEFELSLSKSVKKWTITFNNSILIFFIRLGMSIGGSEDELRNLLE